MNVSSFRIPLLAFGLLGALLHGAEKLDVKDPAPPKVYELPDAVPLEAKSFSRLIFHKAPKALSPTAKTQAWPRFLGATDNAISTETHLEKTFPKGGPVKVWEIGTGTGYTCPTVSNGRMYLFHRWEDQETVECINPETGKRYWMYQYPVAYTDRYGYNNGPRSSVVIDGSKIYTLGVASILHCLRAVDGKVIWKRDLAKEFKVRGKFFGQGSTPLIYKDLLIVNIGAEEGPCVTAFNKLNGSLTWGAGNQWGASYSSPILARLHGKDKILAFAGGESRPPTGGLLCIDPVTGVVDFRFPWRAKKAESVNAAMPVVMGNRIFLTECYSKGGVMLEVTPEFFADPVWEAPKFGVHFMTPVLADGYLYGFDGRHDLQAELVCYEAKTGKEMWRDRQEWQEILPEGRPFNMGLRRGNLLKVDGSWLCLGEYGSLLWMDLTPKGAKVTARHQIFLAQETWTLPSVHRGLLYVAQNKKDHISNRPSRIICYDFRAK
jgi:outer membrane protein assembly factor BamB